MGRSTKLTAEQERAMLAFANFHRRYVALREKADEAADLRMHALDVALELGVPAMTLANASGLTHGRIHQMATQLGRTSQRKHRQTD